MPYSFRVKFNPAFKVLPVLSFKCPPCICVQVPLNIFVVKTLHVKHRNKSCLLCITMHHTTSVTYFPTNAHQIKRYYFFCLAVLLVWGSYSHFHITHRDTNQSWASVNSHMWKGGIALSSKSVMPLLNCALGSLNVLAVGTTKLGSKLGKRCQG